MSINNVVLTGNLTRDAELRVTASGTPVLNFGIAVNDRIKSNGEWTNYANFFDCKMFGAYAESIAEYLYKGLKIAVQGKLRWSQWERDGQKKSKIEILVDEIELLGERKKIQPAEPEIASIYDEDIPF